MQPDPRAEGLRWLEQSRHDLEDARYTSSGARYNLTCFLSQQAAEKALKGFLILRGEESPRGHSVADLCERAAEFDSAFRALQEDAGRLDVFYIPTRYPNGLPGGLPAKAFGVEDAERAIRQAGQIIEAVSGAFEMGQE